MIQFSPYLLTNNATLKRVHGKIPRSTIWDTLVQSVPLTKAIQEYPHYVSYLLYHKMIDIDDFMVLLCSQPKIPHSILQALLEAEAFLQVSDEHFHQVMNIIDEHNIKYLINESKIQERISKLTPHSWTDTQPWMLKFFNHFEFNQHFNVHLHNAFVHLYQHDVTFMLPETLMENRFLMHHEHDLAILLDKHIEPTKKIKYINFIQSYIHKLHFFEQCQMHSSIALWDVRFQSLFKGLPESIKYWDIFRHVSMDEIIAGTYDACLIEQINNIPGMSASEISDALPSQKLTQPSFLLIAMKSIAHHLSQKQATSALFLAIQEGILRQEAYSAICTLTDTDDVSEYFTWFDTLIEQYSYQPHSMRSLDIWIAYQHACTIATLTHVTSPDFKSFLTQLISLPHTITEETKLFL